MAEAFLSSCGIRLEAVDEWYGIQADDGSLIAGAGIQGSTIKCVAVADSHRGEGLLPKLISHIISLHQGENLRVFTKPEYRALFEDLGFRLLAEAPEAVLLENGRGLEVYLKQISRQARNDKSGVIVMNANPFTLGHRYLVEKALEKVGALVIIPVKEEQEFTYEERREMIEKGCEGLPVTVVEGSDYSISALTFPTYFLKDLSQAAETQMRLDLDLFGRHIVPALKADVRFVGTEPEDRLTARYNALMKEMLPIPVVEIERLHGVSASRVRSAKYQEAAAMTPASTHPYLLARLMEKALLAELDTPLKPGLVGPDGCGAHSDMDYVLMRRGAEAVRRSFTAHIGLLPDLAALGKAMEADALAATGGVNTHRGAIFALGLMAVSALKKREIAELSATLKQPEGTHGAAAGEVKGALKMARGGYRELFEDWLPFYRSLEGDPYRMQKTLLRIMSGLDDTCVIHRVGPAMADSIKLESRNLLKDFSVERLQETAHRYNAGRVSPGGSADMLALTVLADTLLT
jgi:[citrate (pro-3S)-lyase] ligase